jgi:carbon-monoxide dehydrogenase medium subunit
VTDLAADPTRGVDRDGRVVLGLGAVGPRPLRTALDAQFDPADVPGLERALDEGLEIATPISDIRGGAEYRHAMVRVLARRAILAAADRRGSGELAA